MLTCATNGGETMATMGKLLGRCHSLKTIKNTYGNQYAQKLCLAISLKGAPLDKLGK